MTSVTINCDHYCRTCGYCNKSNVKFTSLFAMEELKNVLKILKDWSLNIEESDGLPQGVCVDCKNTLENINNFRKKTIAANKNLILLFAGGNKVESNQEENRANQIKHECMSTDDDEENFLERPKFETITIESKELTEMDREEPKIECDSQQASPQQYDTTRQSKPVMDNEGYDSDNVTLSLLCEIEKKKKYKKPRKVIVKKNTGKSKFSMQYDEFAQETSKIDTQPLTKEIHEKKEDTDTDNLTERLLCEIKELAGMPNNTIKTDTNTGKQCRYCFGKSTELPVFSNKEDLEMHLTKKHDKERPYNCIHCTVKYQSRSGVRKHVNTVHLKKHSRNHSKELTIESNEKKKKVESANLTLRLLREIKGLAVKQKSVARRRSQNIAHGTDTKKGERCRYCIGNPTDRPSFANEADFEEHFAKEHYDKKSPYTCVYCRVKYQSRSGVRKHVNNVHLLNQERCDICNKIVPGGTGPLRNHIVSNHTQGDYTCDICGLVLKNSSLNNFNYHKRWHNEDKLLKCDYCERRFVRPTHLRLHIVTHTKQCEFLCTHCGQRTRTNWELRCHLYSEHGEGDAPIKCHICGENFTKRAQKIVHMKKFHSEKQVICEICNKSFSSDSNLHRHLKGQHGINGIHQHLQSSERMQDLLIQ